MFVHMVWFEWRDGASAAEIDAVAAALAGLKGRIPGVLDITCESRSVKPRACPSLATRANVTRQLGAM